MPRVNTHIAKNDVYKQGAQIPSTKTKSGFRRDRSKPFDENDTVFAKKGETYYTWAFRYGGKHESKTYPRQSQLTSSDFLSTVYEMGERIEDMTTDEDFEAFRDTLCEEIETLKDETQEKLDNMPEGLQQGDTGQLLQERVENLESWMDELQGIDIEIDEDLSDEEKEERREEIVEEFQQTSSNC